MLILMYFFKIFMKISRIYHAYRVICQEIIGVPKRREWRFKDVGTP